MSATSINGVVLITIDSLRADAVLGAASETRAPTLTALGDRATTFENAFAHGNWTPFSFPSLLSSRPVFGDSQRVGAPPSKTLAETLRGSGVATAGFNAANGFLTAHWGYDRGFDQFEAFLDPADGRVQEFLAAHPTVQGWLDLLRAQPAQFRARLRGDSDRLVLDTARLRAIEDRAVSFVESVDGPFFLWIHYMDTHTPYVPDRRHREAVSGGSTGTFRMLRAHASAGLGDELDESAVADLRTLYDASVHQVDTSIGRVLAALDGAGRRDDTCVVVAGDHGEEFMEHGHLAHYPKLYDELIHVPLLVDYPGSPARQVSTGVGLGALPPTICAAMDVAPAPSFEGENLLPTVRHGADPDGTPVTSVAVRGDSVTQQPIPRRLDEGTLLVSARTRDWTLILDTESGERQLYDRTTDGPERHDRWPLADTPPVVERLESAATSHANRLHNQAEVGDETAGSGGTEAAGEAVPGAVDQQLRALGYR